MPLALTAVAVAAGVAFYKLMLSKSYADDENIVAQKPGGNICLVVDEAEDITEFVKAYPGLVVVGASNVSLKTGIAEDFRVIETETAEGWIHVVKHLRPDYLVAEDRVLASLPKGMERFTKQIITRTKARELGLDL